MLKKKYVKSRDVCKVTFELAKSELPEDVHVESVALAGDFNDWTPENAGMKYSKKKKAYHTTLDLQPSQSYQFRYVINNGEHWCNDWAADDYTPNEAGDDNCVVDTNTN